MAEFLSNIKISVSDKFYVKDPESSELGKRIVKNSIVLIDKIGFESFTFRKLGELIGSNESSIYRYFESKHNLLLYLTSWYWSWLEYQLVIETHSIQEPNDKLKKAIEIVTRTVKEDTNITHVNEILLNRIIINESSKSFLTKTVDEENKNGFFEVYKRIVVRLSEIIKLVDSEYAYPFSLASTIMEGGLHQHFLKDHFKSITDCSAKITPAMFFSDLTFNMLNCS